MRAMAKNDDDTFKILMMLFTELVLTLEARGALDEPATSGIIDRVLESTPGSEAGISIIGNAINWKRRHGPDRSST